MRKSRRDDLLLITGYVSARQRKTNDCSSERCTLLTTNKCASLRAAIDDIATFPALR